MGEQMTQKPILDLTRTAEIFVGRLPQFGGWPLIVTVVIVIILGRTWMIVVGSACHSRIRCDVS
jgi:hypothetical protein